MPKTTQDLQGEVSQESREVLEERGEENEQGSVQLAADMTDSLHALETRFAADENSGSFEIVRDSTHDLLASLDERVSGDDFLEKFRAMTFRINRVVAACNDYLRSHSGRRWTSRGRGRVEEVRKILADAEAQSVRLRQVDFLVSASPTARSWRDWFTGADQQDDAQDQAPSDTASYRGGVLPTGSEFRQQCEEMSRRGGRSARTLPDGGLIDAIAGLLDDAQVDDSSETGAAVRSFVLDDLLRALDSVPGGNSMIDVLRNRAAYIRVSLPVSDDRRRDLALGEARSYQASFARRTDMRDRLLDEMRQNGQVIPETFSGSNTEFSRVVNRMNPDDEAESRRSLQGELIYHQMDKNAATDEEFNAVKDNIRAAFIQLAGYNLFNLTDAQIMAHYQEILAYEVPSMHTSDMSKIVSASTGRTVREELFNEMGLTEKVFSCICAYASAYRQMGKCLWTLHALDLGWIPRYEELDLQFRKKTNRLQDGTVDPSQLREAAESALELTRSTKRTYDEVAYKDIVASLLAAAQ